MKKIIVYMSLIIFCFTLVFQKNVFCAQRIDDKSLTEEIFKLSQKLAEMISKDPTIKNQSISIGIMDFTNINGEVTENGQIIAHELTISLSKIKKFRVIERKEINKHIAEQRFSASGLVDSNTRKEAGKILGVDAIVYGHIKEEDKKHMGVYVYVSNTETGEVVGEKAIIKCRFVSEKPNVFVEKVLPWIGLIALYVVLYKLGLVRVTN